VQIFDDSGLFQIAANNGIRTMATGAISWGGLGDFNLEIEVVFQLYRKTNNPIIRKSEQIKNHRSTL